MFKKVMPVINWVKNHKYLFVTIVFLAIVIVIDDNNMFKHIKNQRAISALEEEIDQMKRDSAEIMRKQAELEGEGDITLVEKLAREKYGMHKENEDVYVIERTDEDN